MKLFKAQWGAKGPIAVVALGLFSIASLAQAHAMVRSVSIAEGATLTAAPPNLVIVFDHDAGLGSVRLTTASGEVVPLAFTPPRAMGKTFTIPLPRLEADRYKIEWRVIAQDGHVMAAGVNFVISGAPRTLTSAPLPKPKRP